MKEKVLKNNMNVKSSSLLFTIYVSLVLYLIAASFILLYYLYAQYIDRSLILWRLKSSCHSVASYYAANPASGKTFKLPGATENQPRNITIQKNYWGFFELLNINTKKGKHTCKCSYLLGASKKGMDALYLADNNSFLSISGNTTLIGNIVVPGAHIQRKGINVNIMPIDSLRKSGNSLPPINQEIINKLPINIKNLWQWTNKQNILELNDIRSGNLSVPLTDSVMIIHSKEKISLAEIELYGKILVISEKQIEVYSSAKLTDVILFSPSIRINMGFNGSGQFLSDSIIQTGVNCIFGYPSVLAVISEKSSTIQIGEGSKIAGAVIQINNQMGTNSMVEIGNNCIVYGELYSNQTCILKGNIYGSLYARNINYSTLNSRSNALSNVIIDFPSLRNEFVLPLLFENQKKEIIDYNILTSN